MVKKGQLKFLIQIEVILESLLNFKYYRIKAEFHVEGGAFIFCVKIWLKSYRKK